jgi:hypothetical protein
MPDTRKFDTRECPVSPVVVPLFFALPIGARPANRNGKGMFSMKMARTGARTMTLFLVTAFGVLAQAAFAAEPNCRAVETTAARLACYDAAFPPKTKKSIDANIDSPSGYKDPFTEEEARVATKLKNICRGC